MTARNDPLALIVAAARSTDHVGRWIKNDHHRGGHFVVNVTAAAGTTSTFVVTIEGQVPGSTKAYDILLSTGIKSVGVNRLTVYPGVSTVANGAASDVLPAMFRVTSTSVGAQTLTWSVGVNLEI